MSYGLNIARQHAVGPKKRPPDLSRSYTTGKKRRTQIIATYLSGGMQAPSGKTIGLTPNGPQRPRLDQTRSVTVKKRKPPKAHF